MSGKLYSIRLIYERCSKIDHSQSISQEFWQVFLDVLRENECWIVVCAVWRDAIIVVNGRLGFHTNLRVSGSDNFDQVKKSLSFPDL